MQDVDLAAHGITETQARRALPFVTDDGVVHYGHRAVAGALLPGNRWWRLVGHGLRLPGIDQVAGLVYRWVAVHRYRLPGGTTSCQLPRSPSRR